MPAWLRGDVGVAGIINADIEPMTRGESA
jgi:hypothetical protein